MYCVKSEGCHLTTGKFYEILYEANNWVTIKNDMGKVSEYHISYFES